MPSVTKSAVTLWLFVHMELGSEIAPLNNHSELLRFRFQSLNTLVILGIHQIRHHWNKILHWGQAIRIYCYGISSNYGRLGNIALFFSGRKMIRRSRGTHVMVTWTEKATRGSMKWLIRWPGKRSIYKIQHLYNLNVFPIRNHSKEYKEIYSAYHCFMTWP